jgi:hypothetical protein
MVKNYTLVPLGLVPKACDEMRDAIAKDPDHLKWYRTTSNSDWGFRVPDDGDWRSIARAVYVRGRLAGIVSLYVDLETRGVTEIELCGMPNPPCPKAMFSAARDMVRERLKVSTYVRWSCIVGNPVMPAYRRFYASLAVGSANEDPLREGSIYTRYGGAYTVDGIVRDVTVFQVRGDLYVEAP